MRKPVLAIDNDDVLFDFNGALARHHNAQFGTTVQHDTIRSWELHDVYGCTAAEMITRIREFLLHPETDIPPVEGAVEAVRQLSGWYELIVITARTELFREVTQRSIDRHYPGRFQHLYHTGHNTDGSPSHPKSAICLETASVALVDDGIHNAEEAAAAGIRSYMPDKPWNREYTPRGVIRVHNWNELLAHLQPAR